MPFTYDYPRPALTVDCVVFGLDGLDLQVLLIQRDIAPFEGCWALPGGFVHADETLDDAARRELREETSVENVYLEQVLAFGDVDRDPRERVVTIAYFALVNLRDHRVRAATDARNAAWFRIDDIGSLAFDHESIIEAAQVRLRERVRRQPVGFELLPPKFTLRELQYLYEAVLDRPLDKRNFRKKFLAMELLIELDEVETDVAHRAARLYRFDSARYERLCRKGFLFDV